MALVYDRTGFKTFATLEQYYTDTGLNTGVVKPNDPGDPDYIAPIYDTVACPLPVYYSFERSGIFIRSNCGTDYTGGPQTYTVSAGSYTATTQAAADALAQLDVDTWGQNWVDGYGIGGMGYAQAGTCLYTGGSLPYYSYDVRLEEISLDSICGQYITNVFSDSDSFVTGITLYWDPGLVNPVQSALFVSEISQGIIFEMDMVSGVVGFTTGTSCPIPT